MSVDATAGDVAGRLSGVLGEQVVREVAAAGRIEVLRLVRRRVHRRSRSTSVMFEVSLRAPDGTMREARTVVHHDRADLPATATVVPSEVGPLAVWSFPDDPFLPGLTSAVDPARVTELLASLGRPHEEVAITTRAYRPARRAVLQATAGRGAQRGDQVFLKLLAGDRVGVVAEVHRRVVEADLPAPRPLGVADDLGLLVLEALPGRTLRRAVTDRSALPTPVGLVELSARLGEVALPSDRDPVAQADPRRHVPRLAAAFPERATLLGDLAGEAARLEGPRTTVHADLQPRQLLVDERGGLVGLLDLDGAGRGHLASDAGNLVTMLAATVDRYPGLTVEVAALAEAVAAAYRPLVGVRDLDRARAAAWLHLAVGSLRHGTTTSRDLARRRIERAADVLA